MNVVLREFTLAVDKGVREVEAGKFWDRCRAREVGYGKVSQLVTSLEKSMREQDAVALMAAVLSGTSGTAAWELAQSFSVHPGMEAVFCWFCCELLID